MLMSLRRSVNKSVVKYLLFGILILSFGVWGVADLFIPSDGANETVMTAGDREFTYAEVEQNYRRELRALQIDQRTADTALLRSVLDYSLEQMALSALNAQEVERLKIQGARNLVLSEIRDNQNFHDAFGNFDERLFYRFLAISGLTEAEYIAIIAQDIGAQYWLRGLQASLAVPDRLAAVYGDYLRQIRYVDYVEISYDDVEIAAPDQSAMQNYYSENLENYRVAEERQFLLVDISPQSVAGDIDPAEEEIRALYDSGAYSGDSQERRDISFLVFDDEGAARRAYDVLQTGRDIAEAAGDRPVQRLEGQTRASIADGLLAEQAFGLAQAGDIADVFEGTFGWVVLRLDGVSGGQAASYETVRDVIIADIIAERSADIIYDKAQMLEELTSGGATLTEAAADTGLAVTQHSSTDDLSAEIVASAFDLEVGEVSTLIEKSAAGEFGGGFGAEFDGFFMVQLQEVKESHIADFDSVADRIRADMIRAEKINMLEQSAETIRQDESELSEFTSRWGGAIRKAEISLNATGDYPAVLNDSEFRYNVAGWVSYFSGGDSFVIGRLREVSVAPAEEGQENVGEAIIARLMQNMVIASYENLLKSRYEITYNREALDEIIIGNDFSGNQR